VHVLDTGAPAALVVVTHSGGRPWAAATGSGEPAASVASAGGVDGSPTGSAVVADGAAWAGGSSTTVVTARMATVTMAMALVRARTRLLDGR
jgi:hypothetical protein